MTRSPLDMNRSCRKKGCTKVLDLALMIAVEHRWGTRWYCCKEHIPIAKPYKTSVSEPQVVDVNGGPMPV